MVVATSLELFQWNAKAEDEARGLVTSGGENTNGIGTDEGEGVKIVGVTTQQYQQWGA
jgi:hypothetical protein